MNLGRIVPRSPLFVSTSRSFSSKLVKECASRESKILRYFSFVPSFKKRRRIKYRRNLFGNLQKVKDENILWLIGEVIDSFQLGVKPLKGIPLGNLTSQVFANIYLNKLDQYVKHELKIKYNVRCADDFVILDSKKNNLYPCTSLLEYFLKNNLKLELHPRKIIIRKLDWGN